MAHHAVEKALGELLEISPEAAGKVLALFDAFRVEYHEAGRLAREAAVRAGQELEDVLHSREELLQKCAGYSAEVTKLRGLLSGVAGEQQGYRELQDRLGVLGSSNRRLRSELIDARSELAYLRVSVRSLLRVAPTRDVLEHRARQKRWKEAARARRRARVRV